MTNSYNILSENSETTVVAHYTPLPVMRDTAYQSESELEHEFIAQLQRQGYAYVPIKDERALIANLRTQLEQLNHFRFTDGEWDRFFKTELAADSKSIEDKAQTIQTDYVKTLRLDDGTERNVYLLNKEDIHANSTQVINQYAVSTGGVRPNRYDVTILVNGLPLVHVELKRRGRSIKEAFNQIARYGRESFWASNALFDYVQIFIISNGTETKYYSNTTRSGHIKEQAKLKTTTRPRTSNSFEFTSYWADGTNKVLNDLTDFTATFLSRHTLLNVLTRFCVLTEQKLLMVMRPYQIAATEEVLRQIEKAHNQKTYGTREAGGYVWHTTGSGKTLTSFKTAQLATQIDYIDKVLFVVDRKDLDYQTMKEYDRFQKGAANGNTSSKELQRQLESSKSKIIITTIQKLSNFIKTNPQHAIYGKDVVMIFDECHRSQFGEMHTAITKRFKRYYLFGFTGTPIFSENMTSGGLLRTTDDVFGRRLHTYTIVDAIRDHNVLRFRLSYVSTMREKENIRDCMVWDIQREQALSSPQRIHNVASYILDHFDQQTKRASLYTFSKLSNIEEVVKAQSQGRSVKEVRINTRLNGFNSIFAVQSIALAKLYYDELRRLIALRPEGQRLKIATIFSYAANDELQDGLEDENNDDTSALSQSDRDFLEKAIADYNEEFATNYDTSSNSFPNYYKDVSQRMKNREIDLLIVVNMFLTGFDATTLNTLWVDKNLRYHGLLQAFSRTNRILNSVKVAGNIVCFRDLEENTNKALALFGDREAHSTTILRPFADYFFGYKDEEGKWVKGYKAYVEELLEEYVPGVFPLGEKAEKAFIKLFGIVLREYNLLSCFDEFAKMNPLSQRDMQDFTSVYITLAEKYRTQDHQDKTCINDDIEFEMELVKQIEVGIDYILYLITKYKEGHCKDNELRLSIARAIASAPDLRDKKELIEAFVDQLSPSSSVDGEWQTYVNLKKREEFDRLIIDEHLKKDRALTFIENAFKRGYVPVGGLGLNGIMPPLNPFDPAANREGKVQEVLDKIKAFFNKYYEIANGVFR